MDDIDHVEKTLAAWKSEAPPSTDIKHQVMHQIAGLNSANSPSFLRCMHHAAPTIKACSISVAILSLLVIVGLESGFPSGEQDNASAIADHAVQYRFLIDPRVEDTPDDDGFAGAGHDPDLMRVMGWMRGQLHLDSHQFATIIRLHTSFRTQVERLIARQSELQFQYLGFEQQRIADDAVDFIAFYRLLSEEAGLESRAHACRSALVESVLDLLNPTQRTAYLALIQSPAAAFSDA